MCVEHANAVPCRSAVFKWQGPTWTSSEGPLQSMFHLREFVRAMAVSKIGCRKQQHCCEPKMWFYRVLRKNLMNMCFLSCRDGNKCSAITAFGPTNSTKSMFCMTETCSAQWILQWRFASNYNSSHSYPSFRNARPVPIEKCNVYMHVRSWSSSEGRCHGS